MFKHDGWEKLLKEIKECKDLTRLFVELIRGRDVEETRSGVEQLRMIQESNMAGQESAARDKKVRRFLRTLYTCPYRDRKERNRQRVEGTCEWFVGHPLFQK
jgi:hypothetical protein